MGWWILKRPGRRARVGYSLSRGIGCALGWLVVAAVLIALWFSVGAAMDDPAAWTSPAAKTGGLF
jgi:hypothetical protein